MKKIALLIIVSCIFPRLVLAQSKIKLEFDQSYRDVKLNKTNSIMYSIKLEKDRIYEFKCVQDGIDVVTLLKDSKDKVLIEMDSPNGDFGPEIFEYVSNKTDDYIFEIKLLENTPKAETGKVHFKVKSFPANEIEKRKSIQAYLKPYNDKNVQTIDIDHFWQAYDSLKFASDLKDSVSVMQRLYIDRATDGLKDFMRVRNFGAEKLINEMKKFPKFYASVRNNTLKAKETEKLVEEVFQNFKKIYPNFKPFKVCFAIGIANTGGTVSNNFVLIGAEISCATDNVDLSEWGNSTYADMLRSKEDIVQKLYNIVAHECVHTQQVYSIHKDAISCPVLFGVLQEGICDFISEKVTKSHINKTAHKYGDDHEKDLWNLLKTDMCEKESINWLYNGGDVKEMPADLGYYMGYKIAESFYNNAVDKEKAIVDIIEMNDPLKFLIESKYENKFKNN